MHRKHGFLRRTIGVMNEKGPTELSRDLDQVVAMTAEPLLVILAQGFGAAGDHAVATFTCRKFGSPGIRERLLRRIEHLDQMAAYVLRGDGLEPLGHRGDWLEKVAEQKAL